MLGAGRADAALGALAAAQRCGAKVGFLLDAEEAINRCVELRAPREACHYMELRCREAARGSGRRVDNYWLNTAILRFGKAGCAREAEDVYAWMARGRAPSQLPDRNTYHCMFRACRDVARACELWDEMTNSDTALAPNVSTYNYLLDAVHEDVDVAWRAYQDALDNGVTPNTLTFNLLLKAAWRAARADVAYNVMEDLQMRVAQQQQAVAAAPVAAGGTGKDGGKDKGRSAPRVTCAPDVVTFTTLIAVCGAARQPDRAFAVLTQMDRYGIAPNARTWASLASAAGASGQHERALSVLELIRERGERPATEVYNVCLAACARARDAEAQEALLAEMRACDIGGTELCARPDVGTYNALIHACEPARDVARAEALLAQMQAEGLRPDAVTWKSLVAVAAAAGDFGAARSAVQRMRRAHHAADVELYTSLIKCAVKAGSAAEALRAYDEMLHAGVAPNVVTVHTLVTAAEKSGDPGIMPRVFEAYRKVRSAGKARGNGADGTDADGSSASHGGSRRRGGVIPQGSRETQLAWVFDRLTAAWAELVCTAAADGGEDDAGTVVSVADFAGVHLADGTNDRDGRAALMVDVSGLTASEARVAVLCMLRGMRRLWVERCPAGGLVISFDAEESQDERDSRGGAADEGIGAAEAAGTVRGELARLLHALDVPFSVSGGGRRTRSSDGGGGSGRRARESFGNVRRKRAALPSQMMVPEEALMRFLRKAGGSGPSVACK